MKRISLILLSVLLILTFCSCSKSNTDDTLKKEETVSEKKEEKKISPKEKLKTFIDENGTADENKTALVCADAAAIIADYNFTVAAMKNTKASMKQICTMENDSDGVSFKLIDSSITDNGIKMERTVYLHPDGTFEYTNSMIMNGVDFGLSLEGETVVETYSKDKAPVITSSKLAAGAKMTDSVTSTLKDYIDMTLDCYAKALSQEGLELTLADIGYKEYIVEN